MVSGNRGIVNSLKAGKGMLLCSPRSQAEPLLEMLFKTSQANKTANVREDMESWGPWHSWGVFVSSLHAVTKCLAMAS